MTRLIDLWRAIDPDARLVGGNAELLDRTVRGVLRTRAAAPHLPRAGDGDLLIVDTPVLRAEPASLLAAVGDAGLTPAAVLLAEARNPERIDATPYGWPTLATSQRASSLSTAAGEYLAGEAGFLDRFATSLRLAAAESALADPAVAAPAGLVSARLRRGVAVVVDGELRSLHPRPAGRALAARFAALHAGLLAGSSGSGGTRRTRDGLWLTHEPIRAGASVWLFDDLPMARVDMVAAAGLAITLRALLRRPPPTVSLPPPRPGRHPGPSDSLSETLLAVARANGRIAPAARELGVHRNTVLYRLRVARAERGVDPRRPADALRLLREAEERPPGQAHEAN